MVGSGADLLKNRKRDFEYDAFISYRHEEPDRIIAKKLSAALERYSAPLGASKNGVKKIRKVFMDRDELPATDDLSESIKYALQNSRFLIVICSPHVREKPKWIENEIECFIKYRGKQYIQTLLIDGEPEEAFPDSLLYEKVITVLPDGSEAQEMKALEFLAADIRPDELKQYNKEKKLSYGISPDSDKALLRKALKLLKTERLRCLAPMFGCKFDNLYRRHMRRTIRNTVLCSLSAVLLLGGFLAYAININSQLTQQVLETEKQRKEAEKQAGIASANEKEALKNAQDATEQRIEAEHQAELAKLNETKANESSAEATRQRLEAERQAGIAKTNENIANENAVEAQRQQAEAERQKTEAQKQRLEADKQRSEADRQADIAMTERNSALKNQSLYLADLSKKQLDNGDRNTAIMLALQALPADLEKPDRPQLIEAEEALRNAVQSTYSDYIPQQHIRSSTYFKSVDISRDHTLLVSRSEGGKYASVWDTASGNLIRQLGEGDQEINIAKFSPDGKRIVTSTMNNTILWDAETGKKLVTIDAYTFAFDNDDKIDFSPDSKKIVVDTKVFNAANGKLLYTLEGHSSSVETAQFSPDGKKIVTASYDQTAKVWDAKTGRLLCSLEGHEGSVNSAKFSPDSKKIVTASSDKTAIVWDAQSGESLLKLEGLEDEVLSASFGPDGGHVLANSYTETYVWSAYTGEISAKVSGLGGINNAAVFCPYDDSFITASGDCRVWNKYTGGIKNTLIQFNEDQSFQYYNSAFFSQDADKLVVMSGKNIMIWQSIKNPGTYQLDGYTYNALGVSPDNSKIIACNGENAALWEYGTGELLVRLTGHTAPISSAEFSPDGSKVLTVSYDKSIIVWSTKTGRMISRSQTGDYIQSAHFSPDGSRILTVWLDKTKVWDTKTGRMISQFKELTTINTAEFSPDGSRIVTCIDIENTASIWDAETGKLLKKLKGHENAVKSAQFSPDGSKVVTASWDNTAIVWDSTSGRQLTKLSGHTGFVTCASFSPDGSKVVTASWDETALVWEASTGKLIARLTGHNDIVNSAEFSPDGTKVVTTAGDGKVIVWDVASGKTVSEFESFYDLKSARFSKDGTKIIITYGDEITVRDYKALADVITEAQKLLADHKLTDVEKEEFYLE